MIVLRLDVEPLLYWPHFDTEDMERSDDIQNTPLLATKPRSIELGHLKFERTSILLIPNEEPFEGTDISK